MYHVYRNVGALFKTWNISTKLVTLDYSILFFPINHNFSGSPISDAVLNMIIVLSLVIFMTCILVLLYKYRCYKVIEGWLFLSSLILLFMFTFLNLQEVRNLLVLHQLLQPKIWTLTSKLRFSWNCMPSGTLLAFMTFFCLSTYCAYIWTGKNCTSVNLLMVQQWYLTGNEQ
jgi:hypothetical protein